MAKFERAALRRGMKERLKQLQQAVKVLEIHASKEFKRGYELGGVAMKKAIAQAQAEAQQPTKLDGE